MNQPLPTTELPENFLGPQSRREFFRNAFLLGASASAAACSKQTYPTTTPTPIPTATEATPTATTVVHPTATVDTAATADAERANVAELVAKKKEQLTLARDLFCNEVGLPRQDSYLSYTLPSLSRLIAPEHQILNEGWASNEPLSAEQLHNGAKQVLDMAVIDTTTASEIDSSDESKKFAEALFDSYPALGIMLPPIVKVWNDAGAYYGGDHIMVPGIKINASQRLNAYWSEIMHSLFDIQYWDRVNLFDFAKYADLVKVVADESTNIYRSWIDSDDTPFKVDEWAFSEADFKGMVETVKANNPDWINNPDKERYYGTSIDYLAHRIMGQLRELKGRQEDPTDFINKYDQWIHTITNHFAHFAINSFPADYREYNSPTSLQENIGNVIHAVSVLSGNDPAATQEIQSQLVHELTALNLEQSFSLSTDSEVQLKTGRGAISYLIGHVFYTTDAGVLFTNRQEDGIGITIDGQIIQDRTGMNINDINIQPDTDNSVVSLNTDAGKLYVESIIPGQENSGTVSTGKKQILYLNNQMFVLDGVYYSTVSAAMNLTGEIDSDKPATIGVISSWNQESQRTEIFITPQVESFNASFAEITEIFNSFAKPAPASIQNNVEYACHFGYQDTGAKFTIKDAAGNIIFDDYLWSGTASQTPETRKTTNI